METRVWIMTATQVTPTSSPLGHAMTPERGRPTAITVTPFGAASRAIIAIHRLRLASGPPTAPQARDTILALRSREMPKVITRTASVARPVLVPARLVSPRWLSREIQAYAETRYAIFCVIVA